MKIENAPTNIKTVAMAIPCYDHKIEVDTARAAYHALYDPTNPVGTLLFQNGDSLVTRARNTLVARFLDSDKEYLLFIDSDIHFAADDIKKLYDVAQKGRGIVCGMYFKKTIPYRPVANFCMSSEGHLREMKECGTGYMMVHRSVFRGMIDRRLVEPYKNTDDDKSTYKKYDFFKVGVDPDSGLYLSEDYYFCRMAVNVTGYPVLHTGVIGFHAGRAVYPFDDTLTLEFIVDYLTQYSGGMELPKETVERIDNALKKQKTMRGY